jgi:hypothetical protein
LADFDASTLINHWHLSKETQGLPVKVEPLGQCYRTVYVVVFVLFSKDFISKLHINTTNAVKEM